MKPITPAEGWFVSHLYYRVNRRLWGATDRDQKKESRERFVRLCQNFRNVENCQLYSYSVWGLKADFGLMLVDPELHHLNQFQNDLFDIFPGGVLEPSYSFNSMSEISEYITQEEDYDRTLREKDGLEPDSPEYQEKMKSFRERMQVYINDRLYPKIPDHEVMCFYPMDKSRGDVNNWYLLDFETRKKYMSGHAITGQVYRGDVKQLVTGAIGLEEWEWGVTLFSDDPYYFKKIVYEMRYDEASARFGVFGDFLIGIRMEPDQLLERLRL
ncbi:MAG TPA: hydrogen peroxide-dependent heme synthase [Acidobacteriota bacterium]|nr:hydrogen peroxide-dependent heme synthase [Acidobacteriota bacterium]